MRNIPCLFLVHSMLLLTLLLNACGGGGGDTAAPPIQPPPVQQWPQSLAFTDFTGGQTNFVIGANVIFGGSPGNCRLCVSLRGIARSNAELGNLRPDLNTDPAWPAPYNNKPYAELPIDFTTKMAVVLEDVYSEGAYTLSIQKVEESAETITISVLKCGNGFPYFVRDIRSLGLLVPKNNKPIQVLTVQSGKPPLYADDLGAC